MQYSNTQTWLLRTSAVLWLIWGLVHVLGGIMFVFVGGAFEAISTIADKVDPETLNGNYPAALEAILNQHGFNLLWAGAVTIIGSVFIWRKNTAAIFVSALVGGLFDVGYFVFLDLGGYVNFVPGTIMTIVSASAISLSFYAYFNTKKHP